MGNERLIEESKHDLVEYLLSQRRAIEKNPQLALVVYDGTIDALRRAIECLPSVWDVQNVFSKYRARVE